jgi:hypothetical protein
MLKRTSEMTKAEKEGQRQVHKLVRLMHDVKGWNDPPWTEEEEQEWIELFERPTFDFDLYRRALTAFTRGDSPWGRETVNPYRRPSPLVFLEQVRLIRGELHDWEVDGSAPPEPPDLRLPPEDQPF